MNFSCLHSTLWWDFADNDSFFHHRFYCSYSTLRYLCTLCSFWLKRHLLSLIAMHLVNKKKSFWFTKYISAIAWSNTHMALGCLLTHRHNEQQSRSISPRSYYLHRSGSWSWWFSEIPAMATRGDLTLILPQSWELLPSVWQWVVWFHILQ